MHSERVGVVARTLRLGQTVFLLVDIRQVEVFYSILSKLWLRLQLKGRRATEGRRQDFRSRRDECKSSLLGWKKYNPAASSLNYGINCWSSSNTYDAFIWRRRFACFAHIWPQALGPVFNGVACFWQEQAWRENFGDGGCVWGCEAARKIWNWTGKMHTHGHIIPQFWGEYKDMFLKMISVRFFKKYELNTFPSFLKLWKITLFIFIRAHLWSVQVAVIRSNLCFVDPPPAEIISSHFYLLCSPQLFLHSVFGYRGIVLFPWHARLYDRDITPPVSDRWNSYLQLQAAPGTRPSLPWFVGKEPFWSWLLFCLLLLQQTWAPWSPRLQGGEGKDPHLLPSPYWHPRLPPHSEWFYYCCKAAWHRLHQVLIYNPVWFHLLFVDFE